MHITDDMLQSMRALIETAEVHPSLPQDADKADLMTAALRHLGSRLADDELKQILAAAAKDAGL